MQISNDIRACVPALLLPFLELAATPHRFLHLAEKEVERMMLSNQTQESHRFVIGFRMYINGYPCNSSGMFELGWLVAKELIPEGFLSMHSL